jgi:hypothetical protein
MLRFGSPRTDGARSAPTDPSVYSNAWQKVLPIGARASQKTEVLMKVPDANLIWLDGDGEACGSS